MESTTTTEALQAIIDCLEEAKADADKFDAGNDSAGMRVRKALQNAANSCKLGRVAIQETRNARKEAKSSVA